MVICVYPLYLIVHTFVMIETYQHFKLYLKLHRLMCLYKKVNLKVCIGPKWLHALIARSFQKYFAGGLYSPE